MQITSFLVELFLKFNSDLYLQLFQEIVINLDRYTTSKIRW